MSATSLIQKDPNGVRRALILAGGGVRLAYQAGVLQALAEKGLQFGHFDGTSGGIFNTAMLASGLDPDEMARRWRSLRLKDFMSTLPIKDYFKVGRTPALGDADGLRQKVFPALGIDLEKIRSNTEITATFNVCNFSEKSIESIPHRQVTEDHLIAGMSLPMFMPAIQINGDWYSDAVWIKDANLMEAVRRGAEEIWLVWAIGNSNAYLPGFFNQYVHMIEMSANGGLLEEYAQIKSLNERILKGDSPFGQRSPVQLHVIRPVFPLPLDPDLLDQKTTTNTLINGGYADARKYLGRIPENGIAFDTASTKMKEPGVTLHFRQHYAGTPAFGDSKSFVSYRPAFHFRRWGHEVALDVDASVFVATLGREIATFNNKAELKRGPQGAYIQVTSEFEHDRQIYALQATIRLGTPIEWWLGLEFKRVKLQIDRNTENLLHGQLTQSIKKRFKGILNSSLRHFYGPGGNLREKRRMIFYLYRHEI